MTKWLATFSFDTFAAFIITYYLLQYSLKTTGPHQRNGLFLYM